MVVTDTVHRHVETWMRRHIPATAPTRSSPTSPPAYGQLNVQGPRSRELLQSMTSADLSNEAFPFRTAREIDIGFARVLCIRITYLGELGYELYIPAEQAVHVYDRLVEAGDGASACATPASRRSPACAWRRATATTATTSTTPTTSSRPGSASSVDLDEARRLHRPRGRALAQKAQAPLTPAAWCRCWSRTPSR